MQWISKPMVDLEKGSINTHRLFTFLTSSIVNIYGLYEVPGTIIFIIPIRKYLSIRGLSSGCFSKSIMKVLQLSTKQRFVRSANSIMSIRTLTIPNRFALVKLLPTHFFV